jgi:hypothetical protein
MCLTYGLPQHQNKVINYYVVKLLFFFYYSNMGKGLQGIQTT